MRERSGRRSLPWAAAAVAAAMAVSGGVAAAQEAPGNWGAVVEQAKAEGRVTFYSVAPPDQGQRLIEAFNAVYPEIRVAHTRGAGEILPRVAAERESGTDGADVVVYSDPLWFAQNAEHLLTLTGPSAAAFPAEGWEVPGQVPLVSFPPFGMLIWNTEALPGGVATYEDLLRPELAGHIGTREDVTASFAGYLDFLETEFGVDYLAALGAQDPKFYASVVPLTQAVAAGEVWVANIGVPSTVQDLLDQGAPIAAAIPTPGFAIAWAGGAVAQSRRPNAARVFMDFMMSPAGQEALNGEGRAGSALGVPGSVDMSGMRVFDSGRFDGEARAEWQRKFDQFFRSNG